jgi:pimeloyl-ACP methyl ester carboxylesterase
MPVADNIFYYLFEGSSHELKPTVVLIHGAGGTHLYWPAEIRRLIGYRVYAPDLPGHGKSGGRGLQSIDSYAEMLMDWLTNLGIYGVILVGHSMGSAIALTLALNHSERVAGLVLIGAGARLPVAPTLLSSIESSSTYLNAISLVVDWSFSSQSPPRLKELAEKRMTETRQSVLYGDFLACANFDVRDRIDQIHKPTLIMCGMEDKMTPVRHSQLLKEWIRDARMDLIPDAGHMVQLEKPRPVADKILEFLNGIQYM